jgi:hypothetical protein
MNFYILGPFLIVSHFAGNSITDSPLLPCPSLDITEFGLEWGYHAPEDFPIWGRLDVIGSDTDLFTGN